MKVKGKERQAKGKKASLLSKQGQSKPVLSQCGLQFVKVSRSRLHFVEVVSTFSRLPVLTTI